MPGVREVAVPDTSRLIALAAIDRVDLLRSVSARTTEPCAVQLGTPHRCVTWNTEPGTGFRPRAGAERPFRVRHSAAWSAEPGTDYDCVREPKSCSGFGVSCDLL